MSAQRSLSICILYFIFQSNNTYYELSRYSRYYFASDNLFESIYSFEHNIPELFLILYVYVKWYHTEFYIEGF